ncbi:MAG: YolD-like family protein [Eubacterium sp.]|nr:YolD-like family protein [Eubacterium sp.]
MPISERAKQFMPFAAVKGLEEALAAKERERTFIPRTELSDHAAERLNRRLCRLEWGDTVTVKYYRHGEYLTASGRITRLDVTYRVMMIGEDIVIDFDDIYSVTAERRTM